MKNDLINYKVEALSEAEMEDINGGSLSKAVKSFIVAFWNWLFTPPKNTNLNF